MPATRTDLKQELGELYRPTAQPRLVEVPELTFLMTDGHGDPSASGRFSAATGALYALAYTAKFMLRRRTGEDFAVMPLEGLWWAPEMTAFLTGQKAAWEWTLMMVVPDFVTADVVDAARGRAATKKGADRAAIDAIRLERFDEGLCAQVLHVGPYSAEAPTIAGLHRFIAGHGLVRAGRHHEIYLGDPRRAAPERLRTIIRQPVWPVAID